MLGALAAVAVPPLLAAALLVLTLVERSFLASSGWSAVHRTPVEWPSLLALGPYGPALTAMLVASVAFVVAFAATLMRCAASRSERAAAIFVGVAGIAFALEAFPANTPLATEGSWHADIHNAVFPLIPASVLTAALVLLLQTVTRQDGRVASTASDASPDDARGPRAGDRRRKGAQRQRQDLPLLPVA
jgi:hypothetical protein